MSDFVKFARVFAIFHILYQIWEEEGARAGILFENSCGRKGTPLIIVAFQKIIIDKPPGGGNIVNTEAYLSLSLLSSCLT